MFTSHRARVVEGLRLPLSALGSYMCGVQGGVAAVTFSTATLDEGFINTTEYISNGFRIGPSNTGRTILTQPG